MDLEEVLLAPREADIPSLAVEALHRSGLVGEDRLIKLVYLAVTSRLFPKPINLIVKGPSSAGKSETVGRVLKLFPPEAYIERTSLSPKALAYTAENLSHRTLVLYEAQGMGQEGDYLIRSLLSEGRIAHEVVTEKRDGTEIMVREGPTGFISTTTAVKLHPENETRMFSVPVDDSKVQTAAIIAALADGAGQDLNVEPWHEFQRWLEDGPVEVDIPFASELAKLTKPAAVHMRRAFGQTLGLIRAHALVHRGNRAIVQERIVATIEDYRAVHDLVHDLVSDGVGATVKPKVRETVNAVQLIAGQGTATITQVAERIDLDVSSASRRVSEAIEAGYLTNLETKLGLPAKLTTADPLPEDHEILPNPDRLHDCIEVDF